MKVYRVLSFDRGLLFTLKFVSKGKIKKTVMFYKE